MGSLDRITPVSNNWGLDRGTPIDRHYIESFLYDCSSDIKGRVLEVANNEYTQRFGGDRVTQSDILHNAPGLKRATMVLDLASPSDAPVDLFDCIICTQTLHLIYDIQSAIRTLNKLLKPGGVLLLTAPAITPISRSDMESHGDHWRFTSPTLRRLFEESSGWSDIEIRSFGNVYAAITFLHGLAVEELDKDKLSRFDPDYEILIALQITKQKKTDENSRHQ
jgi:SAM-dependent methyltransferase